MIMMILSIFILFLFLSFCVWVAGLFSYVIYLLICDTIETWGWPKEIQRQEDEWVDHMMACARRVEAENASSSINQPPRGRNDSI